MLEGVLRDSIAGYLEDLEDVVQFLPFSTLGPKNIDCSSTVEIGYPPTIEQPAGNPSELLDFFVVRIPKLCL